MVMDLIFLEAPPTEEVNLRFGTIINGNKFSETQHTTKRVNAEQFNMACKQEMTHAAVVTLLM